MKLIICCLFTLLVVVIAEQSKENINLVKSLLNNAETITYDYGRAAHGLKVDSSITHENLQKVLVGAENNNPIQVYFLGILKLYGIGISKNEVEAVQNFKKAADLGNKDGITAYAVSLLNGVGIQQNYAEAIVWLQKGISLQDPNAFFFMGSMLLEGKGFA